MMTKIYNNDAAILFNQANNDADIFSSHLGTENIVRLRSPSRRLAGVVSCAGSGIYYDILYRKLGENALTCRNRRYQSGHNCLSFFIYIWRIILIRRRADFHAPTIVFNIITQLSVHMVAVTDIMYGRQKQSISALGCFFIFCRTVKAVERDTAT